MQTWVIGLIAVLVVGVAVILYGALSDRAKHRRRVAELTSAPNRAIPRLAAQAVTPRYLSDLQARRPPSRASATMSEADGRRLDDELGADTTLTVPLGYASRDFVTDAAADRAVLDHPAILVCAEAVVSIRELIGVLEQTIRADGALVVMCPSIDADVLATLEVNRIQGLLRVLVVLGKKPEPVDAVRAATGARLIGRTDLQAGYVTADDLGRCRRWVSTRTHSHVVGGAAEADGQRLSG